MCCKSVDSPAVNEWYLQATAITVLSMRSRLVGEAQKQGNSRCCIGNMKLRSRVLRRLVPNSKMQQFTQAPRPRTVQQYNRYESATI